jgi:Zn-dependent protease
MNLIPVWTLDGGQAMVAINRPERIGIAIAAVLIRFCTGNILQSRRPKYGSKYHK